MKKSVFLNKSSRTKLFTVITALLIIAVFGINILLTYLTSKNASYLDLTPEGLYTPTDKMIEVCSFIDELPEGKEIKITFCTDPDYIMNNEVLRAPYLMAKALEREFDNLTVETVNIAVNPTAVAAYKTTALSTISATDIIVSYGNRYRIASANRFWVGTAEDSGAHIAFDGEYELASMLLSLTSRQLPVAYFVSNHGELVFDPAKPDSDGSVKTRELASLLENRGMQIKTLDLSAVEKIPDDCSLLIINNPKTDFIADPDRLNELFYVSETEMIENYLISGNGAVMVALDYDLRNYEGYAAAEAAGELEGFEPLKNLKAFLVQWGFKFSNYKVKDTENAVDSSDPSVFVGTYVTENDSFAMGIYNSFATSNSAPKMLFKNAGFIESAFGSVANEHGSSQIFRHFDEFIHTSDKAIGYGYSSSAGAYDAEATPAGKKALAAVTTRSYLDPVAAVHTYSHVFCVNSTEFFSNETLTDTSYSNYDIVSALVTSMVRTDTYASIELGGLSGNSSSRLGKLLVPEALSELPTKEQAGLDKTDTTVYSVIIFAIPIAICVLGIIMCIRRKFL